MEEKKETKKAPAKKTSAAKKTTTKKPAAKKTNTTKKNTVKKTEVKKPEVSYCGNCGKTINAGEVCECVKKAEPVINIDKEVLVEKSEAIVEKGRGIFEIILNVFKNPYSTCKEESENKEIKNSMIILVLIAISIGLLISAITYASFHTKVGTFGTVSDYYEISYFKVFVVWTIVSFVMGFLPIIVAHVGSLMFSKSDFKFTKSINLYASSLSVVILVNALSAIFIFAGLFIKFFLLISLLALVLGFINYLFIYRDEVSFEKEKEPYIFLGIILALILGVAVITSLFTSGIDGLNAFETIISTINK